MVRKEYPVSSACVCGHTLAHHKFAVWDSIKDINRCYFIPCGCNEFKRDNLHYLLEKYESDHS